MGPCLFITFMIYVCFFGIEAGEDARENAMFANNLRLLVARATRSLSIPERMPILAIIRRQPVACATTSLFVFYGIAQENTVLVMILSKALAKNYEKELFRWGRNYILKIGLV